MESQQPLADTDLCVKCGLCLPHCPTYQDSREEGDSPRGRITQLQALASGQLQLSPRGVSHLHSCLNCSACEPVCPAKVPYRKLIDHGRTLTPAAIPLRARMLGHPAGRRLIDAAVWLALALRVPKLAQLLHYFGSRRLRQLLGSLGDATTLPPTTTATGDRGSLQVFTGCTGNNLDRAAMHHSRALFSALGYAVTAPAAQTCCGAIHGHAGHQARAQEMALANERAFGTGAELIVGIASGCEAWLRDYGQLLGRPSAISTRLQDFSSFVEAATRDARFSPLHETVALHLPCTQRNVLKSGKALLQCLRRIPGLEIVIIGEQQSCCGAAGTHVLNNPERAERFAAPYIAQLGGMKPKPTRLISANIGCSMHLSSQLAEAGIPLGIEHPAQLLLRQLARGNSVSSRSSISSASSS